MKLSARNRLRGTITRISVGEVTASVELDVEGQRVVAAITAEAVRDLALNVGDQALAVVKASDVMIATED